MQLSGAGARRLERGAALGDARGGRVVPEHPARGLAHGLEHFAITVRAELLKGADRLVDLGPDGATLQDIAGEAEVPVAADNQHEPQASGQVRGVDAQRGEPGELCGPHDLALGSAPRAAQLAACGIGRLLALVAWRDRRLRDRWRVPPLLYTYWRRKARRLLTSARKQDIIRYILLYRDMPSTIEQRRSLGTPGPLRPTKGDNICFTDGVCITGTRHLPGCTIARRGRRKGRRPGPGSGAHHSAHRGVGGSGGWAGDSRAARVGRGPLGAGT